MLQHLSIKNYALIDHLELDFHNGFSVITGETGAGKSIMLSALSLILGKRADLQSIKNQDSKCIVEGAFRLQKKQYFKFFKENDLDFEETSILRREITPSGKSRAFINDTPVTLDILSKLAERLIDVHSQHQNLLLTDVGFQLQLLDNFSSNESDLNQYITAFKVHKEQKNKLDKLVETAKNESGDTDYLQFLLDELLSAELKEGEQQELEKELDLLENAEEIQSGLALSVSLLEENDPSLSSLLDQLINQIHSLQKFDESLPSIANRIESSKIELDDISAEIKQKLAEIDFEPNRSAYLDERISLLLSLQRKHQAVDLSELIQKRNELDERILNLSSLETNIEELKLKVEELKEEMMQTATVLHKSRLKVIPSLEKQILELLADLNMPDAEFNISLERVDNYTEKGNAKIDFLFSANKGQSINKLSKVASGGELSRVMLALKAIMAQTQNLPSIIFDEIDAGVSGETAGKIGGILKHMGKHMQVIAISHLPQIASIGAAHYKVEKWVDENVSKTRIFELNLNERITELARLLSGEKISEAALENARELLQSN